jgi:S-adenosylmethionine:tRNA ribosyltransferase-isomerase
LRTSDFDYNLPEEYIAQTPIEPRDHSKLLVYNRQTGQIIHAQFRDLCQFLDKDDLLVINETRVIAARIFAKKETGGKAELLLLNKIDLFTWEAMVRGKHLVEGSKLYIENGISAQIISALDDARRIVKFSSPVEEFIGQVWHTPLPPYIHAALSNPERYQTIYARENGSAAAPTAGLHFTPELFNTINHHGIQIAKVILHVGMDTFTPVREDDAEQHVIHTEWCAVPAQTVEMIRKAHQYGRRVVAVGTTTVRALESAAKGVGDGHEIAAYEGNTDLFILPGYQYKVIDAMITNFHLPRSTLIMLVSAFTGKEKILELYEIAKQEKYRFYSFGDAMLLL